MQERSCTTMPKCSAIATRVLSAVFLLIACAYHNTMLVVAECACGYRYDLLMELYHSTNGAFWTDSNGWGDYNACTWFGVTCSGTDVTAVVLPSNNLRGPLPASWSNLTNLQVLQLYSNSLSGTLPDSLSAMTLLEDLQLHSNSLTGTLPDSWSAMSAIRVLLLCSNEFTGTLPAGWSAMSALRALYLFTNGLSGMLPDSWSALAQLEDLRLYSNSLSGALPESWSNCTSLQTVQLQTNSLNGTLPADWSSMRSLQVLYLFTNGFVGTLPDSWSAMSALRVLLLCVNSLSGTLPSSWSALTLLEDLQLYSNSLTGTLPETWSAMTALRLLYLYTNSLNGTLPANWGNLTNLHVLQLHRNSLNGSLPGSWSALAQLEDLQLYSNSLSGTLPDSWSAMSALHLLYLCMNSLSGALPGSWSSMAILEDLQLYSNSFSGTLPESWSTMSSLRVLYLFTNSLNGTLPANWGNLTNLQVLQLFSNSLSGTLPESWSALAQLDDLRLCINSLSGTLPANWSSMRSLQVLYLFTNGFVGMLPDSWSAMLAIRLAHLHTNSLNGSLPGSWSALTQLEVLQLHSNSLQGTLPPSWGNLTSLKSLDVHSNCLQGAVPSSYAFPSMTAGGLNVCNTRVLGGQHLAVCSNTKRWALHCSASVTVATTRTLTPSTSLLLTTTPLLTPSESRLVGSLSFGSGTSSLCRSLSHSLRGSASASMESLPLSSQVLSLSQSALCHLDNVRVRLRTVDDVGLVVAVEPGVMVLLLQPAGSEIRESIKDGTTTTVAVTLTAQAVARQALLASPSICMNVTFLNPLDACCRVVNVTNTGETGTAANWSVHVVGGATSWFAVTAQAPSAGWVGGTPLLLDTTVELTITVACGPAASASIAVRVPAPGVPRDYATHVEAAGRYSQIASVLANGASSGTALGRVMAVRSMVLCDADAAVGGGLIDLSLSVCAGGAGSSSAVARSAVLSNIVVVLVTCCVLLLLGAALSPRAAWQDALLSLCLPSSLLPVWTAVLPSTGASATLLLGRLSGSACVAADVVLAVLGLGVAVCPSAVLWVLWWSCMRGDAPLLDCKRRADGNARRLSLPTHRVRAWALAVTRRRWDWHASGATRVVRCAWVVLLEHRMVWYAALDSVCLAAIACLSIASGLGGTALCHGLSVVTVLVLLAQLAVVVCAGPLTSTFSHVYACTTLALTFVGALAQVTFMFVESSTSTSWLWLVEASASCSLAVVGVTAVRLLLDCAAVAAALRRRLPMLRNTPENLSFVAVALAAFEQLKEHDDITTTLEAAPHIGEDGVGAGMLGSMTLGSVTVGSVTGSEVFWDEKGNAKGTVVSAEDARVEILTKRSAGVSIDVACMSSA